MPDPQHEGDYYDSSDLTVTTKQFTMSEMLSDPAFRQDLMDHGWADIKNFGKLSTDDSFGPRLFSLGVPTRTGAGSNYTSGYAIDPGDASGMHSYLRNSPNQVFAIEVGPEIIAKIAPVHHETYVKALAARKRAEKALIEAQKKRQEKAAEAKARREANKLEEARKVLEKAGIKVELTDAVIEQAKKVVQKAAKKAKK